MNTLKFEIEQLPELVGLITNLNAKLAEYSAMQNDGVWLNDEGAMLRLGISKSTLHNWRENYALPFSQLGEVRRYRPEELDDWMRMFRPGNKQAIQIVNEAMSKKAQKVA